MQFRLTATSLTIGNGSARSMASGAHFTYQPTASRVLFGRVDISWLLSGHLEMLKTERIAWENFEGNPHSAGKGFAESDLPLRTVPAILSVPSSIVPKRRQWGNLLRIATKEIISPKMKLAVIHATIYKPLQGCWGEALVQNNCSPTSKSPESTTWQFRSSKLEWPALAESASSTR